MQALRQILDVKNHSLNIHLPDDFNAKRVEIIILPLDSQPVKIENIAKLRGKLKLTEKQYLDFQTYIKQLLPVFLS